MVNSVVYVMVRLIACFTAAGFVLLFWLDWFVCLISVWITVVGLVIDGVDAVSG